MSANFTPDMVGYKGLSPFRFWCQKTLPLVYDDSLSYYELLCKVVSYINNLITDVAATEENVDRLLTAYNQLQEYVNNYFDGADFQQKIDDSLDRYAEDGTLSAMVNTHVRALLPYEVGQQIGDVVDEQLAPVVDLKLGAVVDTKLPDVVDDKLEDVVHPMIVPAVSGLLPQEVGRQLPDEVETQLPGAIGEDLETIAPPVIQQWLNDHPDATTSVEDGSISLVKLNTALQRLARLDGNFYPREYDPTVTYYTDDMCTYRNTLTDVEMAYKCIATSTTGTFSAADWAVVDENDIVINARAIHDLASSIAPLYQYPNNPAISAGTIFFYRGNARNAPYGLWRATTDIPAATFVTPSYAERVTILDLIDGIDQLETDVADLKSALNNTASITGKVFDLVFTQDKFIKTSDGAIGNASGRYATEPYYPVNAGDVLLTNLLENGSGEASVAFYDTNKTYLSEYKNQLGAVRYVVTSDGFVRFSTRSPILPADAYAKIIGKVENNSNAIYNISDELADVVATNPELYAFNKDGYRYASINTSKTIINNSSRVIVYIPCNANTKYTIAKASGTVFMVGETTVKPDNGVVCTSIVEDYEGATTLEYTTGSTAVWLVAVVWTSNDGDLMSMLNSVSIKKDIEPTAIDKIARASNGIALNILKYDALTKNDNKLYIKQDFDMAVTGWSNANATLTQDVTGVMLTCANVSGRHTMYKNMSASPIDIRKSFVGVDLTVHAGVSGETSDFNNISEIDIVLSDKNSYADSSAVFFPLIVNASYILYSGDYKVSTSLDIQRNNGTTEIDLSAVKFIGIQIITKSPYTGTPSITIDRFFVYAPPRKKQVVIGFDGGYASQLIAGDYLADNDMSGTFYVRQQTMGDTGKMVLGDLYDLQSAGHLVANYAKPEGTDKYWYQMTLTEKKAAIKYQADWLYKHGFGEGAACISVPGGGYAADEDELYATGLATSITGRILPCSANEPCAYYGPHIAGHSAGPAATNTARFQVIDSLIRTGGFAIFIFHQCAAASADDISLADFKEFVDYVKTKRDAGLLEVINAKDLASYTLATAPNAT